VPVHAAHLAKRGSDLVAVSSQRMLQSEHDSTVWGHAASHSGVCESTTSDLRSMVKIRGDIIPAGISSSDIFFLP
jgi:hypothetical protein